MKGEDRIFCHIKVNGNNKSMLILEGATEIPDYLNISIHLIGTQSHQATTYLHDPVPAQSETVQEKLGVLILEGEPVLLVGSQFPGVSGETWNALKNHWFLSVRLQ